MTGAVYGGGVAADCRCPLCALGRATFQARVDHARRVLGAAREELGECLGGFSAVDLLLDQEVAEDVDEARALLRAVEA